MRKSRALIVLFTMTVVVLAPMVCNGQEEEPTETEMVRQLTSDNAEFALELYQSVRREMGNLFFSPFSVSSALAMTFAGARGNTAGQMAEALHLTAEGDRLHESFGSLNENLNTRGGSGTVELRVANALWGQEGEGFLKDFVDVGRKYYGAELAQVDFGGDPAGAADRINTWASDATRGRIPSLLEPGMLGKATMLVLTNAIHFKGQWASRFEADETRDEPFWVAPDSSVITGMMHQTRPFRYTETSALQILELPYDGGDLSMIVLLPKERTGLAGAERFLTLKSLRVWLRQLREEELVISFPKFSFSSDLLLNDALKGLGMTDAFDGALADFSGMTGKKGLFIDAVVHKGFVEVAEEGTEAAASTAVVMKKSSVSRPKQFRADHPFIFMIRDNTTGSILFLGRLVDPRN